MIQDDPGGDKENKMIAPQIKIKPKENLILVEQSLEIEKLKKIVKN